MNLFKNVPSFFFSLFFLLSGGMVYASIYSDLHPYLTGGGGTTHVNYSKNVWLAYTPEPGLENNFTVDLNNHNTYFVGAGVEKHLSKKLFDIEPSLGIEINYLNNDSFNGVIHPMVNVAADFDVLNYSYDMNSLSLYLTGKLSKQLLFSNLGIYLQGGIGGAINKVKNYIERSPEDSSASPMLEPFRDGSKRNFAYLIGVGVSYQVQKAQFSLGYRYVFSGSSGFKPSSIQETNNALNFSPLTNQFLVLGFMI